MDERHTLLMLKLKQIKLGKFKVQDLLSIYISSNTYINYTLNFFNKLVGFLFTYSL